MDLPGRDHIPWGGAALATTLALLVSIDRAIFAVGGVTLAAGCEALARWSLGDRPSTAFSRYGRYLAGLLGLQVLLLATAPIASASYPEFLKETWRVVGAYRSQDGARLGRRDFTLGRRGFNDVRDPVRMGLGAFAHRRPRACNVARR